MTEAYSETSQIYNMAHFAKQSMLEVWQGFDYVCAWHEQLSHTHDQHRLDLTQQT